MEGVDVREIRGDGGVIVRIAVEEDGRVGDGGVFQDPDRLLAVWAAAAREGGVAQREAHVVGHGRVEAQGLGDGPLQVGAVPDGFEARLLGGADGVEDFFPEFGQDVRVAR